MQNTRYYDLGKLEEEAKINSKAKETLEKIHRESKDEDLERLRRKYIDAANHGDLVTAKYYEKLLVNYKK